MWEWLCKVGIHKWYRNKTTFSHAFDVKDTYRCTRCGKSKEVLWL